MLVFDEPRGDARRRAAAAGRGLRGGRRPLAVRAPRGGRGAGPAARRGSPSPPSSEGSSGGRRQLRLPGLGRTWWTGRSIIGGQAGHRAPGPRPGHLRADRPRAPPSRRSGRSSSRRRLFPRLVPAPRAVAAGPARHRRPVRRPRRRARRRLLARALPRRCAWRSAACEVVEDWRVWREGAAAAVLPSSPPSSLPGCRAQGEKPGFVVHSGDDRLRALRRLRPQPDRPRPARRSSRRREGTVPLADARSRTGRGRRRRERAGRELRNPLEPTRPSLARGKQVFENVCTVCHGPDGQGDGPIIGRFPNPPSLLAPRAKGLPDGQIVHVITRGQGIMPSHAAQVLPEDRWRVVLHLRQLQEGRPMSTASAARPLRLLRPGSLGACSRRGRRVALAVVLAAHRGGRPGLLTAGALRHDARPRAGRSSSPSRS